MVPGFIVSVGAKILQHFDHLATSLIFNIPYSTDGKSSKTSVFSWCRNTKYNSHRRKSVSKLSNLRIKESSLDWRALSKTNMRQLRNFKTTWWAANQGICLNPPPTLTMCLPPKRRQLLPLISRLPSTNSWGKFEKKENQINDCPFVAPKLLGQLSFCSFRKTRTKNTERGSSLLYSSLRLERRSLHEDKIRLMSTLEIERAEKSSMRQVTKISVKAI